MTEFRVLTLWQPWATLISLGIERYETRGRNPGRTLYRGKLVIHAASKSSYTMESEDVHLFHRAIETARKAGMEIPPEKALPEQMPYGCIVAIADLTDSLEMVGSRDFTQGAGQICIEYQTCLERAVGNWEKGRYALKLENVIALPKPISYKGGQSLRWLNDAAIAQQLEQLISQ